MSSVALSHVRRAYAGVAALDEVSLTAPEAKVLVLLGPSGSGKSTILRLVAGLEPIDAGEVRIGDELVSAPGRTLPAEQRRIGMVFQDYALFPHLSVADNVAFGLHRLDRKTRKQRALQYLEAVGLAAHAAKHPHQLSGGQQQRVALARALAPQPDLILLDEPFSNLDVELRERLSLEVREIIKRSNTTAILVTHDQHEAFAIADEIGIMHEGRIQQWDNAYNLYHRPANRFIADFVGQGVFLPGRVLPSLEVRIELGTLKQAIHQCCNGVDPAHKEGCQVEVLLRPDDIVHDDSSPLQAEVVHKAFKGAEILYTLKLESGRPLLALVPSHHNHALGERIGIRLDVDHVVAFPPAH